MKTVTRTLIAGLVASVVFGTTAVTNAQSARSFFNQVAKSVQGQALQAGGNGLAGRFQGQAKLQGGFDKHFPGGSGSYGPGHWLPEPPSCPPPHCGGGYCPPPPPPCHVYIVYYYDCHCGWKTYGTYHSYHAAQNAVYSLQQRGYRAYMQQARR